MSQAGVHAASQPWRALRRAGGLLTAKLAKRAQDLHKYIYTISENVVTDTERDASKLPKWLNSCYREVPVRSVESPAQTDPHTYTGSGVVVLPRGNSGSTGKASESEEGVAACTLARSEQNTPAMQPIPWLAPPQRCRFGVFLFVFAF